MNQRFDPTRRLLLAASAALHGGAGRVFVGLLDGGSMSVDTRNTVASTAVIAAAASVSSAKSRSDTASSEFSKRRENPSAAAV